MASTAPASTPLAAASLPRTPSAASAPRRPVSSRRGARLGASPQRLPLLLATAIAAATLLLLLPAHADAARLIGHPVADAQSARYPTLLQQQEEKLQQLPNKVTSFRSLLTGHAMAPPPGYGIYTSPGPYGVYPSPPSYGVYPSPVTPPAYPDYPPRPAPESPPRV